MLQKIYIEITNKCNLKCSFCPQAKRESKVLSLNDFEKILKQALPLSKDICLYLAGEPLSHPDLSGIIKICDNNKAQIQITTNGLYIKKYQELVLTSTSIRQINFSIQCYKDNFPEKNIDDYLETILNFSIQANSKRPELYINLRLWNYVENSQDNEDIFLYLEKYLHIKINRKVEIGHRNSKLLCNRLYMHFDTRFEWPSMELPYKGVTGTCHALTGHLGILADGTVVPCCLDKDGQVSLGNCLKQHLRDILNNERVKKMQEGFEKKSLVEKLCQHCSYIKRFK